MDAQDITAQLAQIRLAGSRCRELHAEYLIDKERAADTKKAWEAACERLQELSCKWEDSEEVAARPLIAAVEAKAEKTDPRVVKDTFEALISVGHTDDQARNAIDRVKGILFTSVNDMLDAIYKEYPDKANPSASGNGFDLVTSGLTKPGRKRRDATKNPA